MISSVNPIPYSRVKDLFTLQTHVIYARDRVVSTPCPFPCLTILRISRIKAPDVTSLFCHDLYSLSSTGIYT